MTLLRWHLGLGDALICNGLVRVLVEREGVIGLPCWKHNLATLEAMFSDIRESILLYPVNSEAELSDYDGDAINLGYYGKGFDPLRWHESFYRQAGVPFLATWERFKIDYDEPDEYPTPKRFIHDDASRGFEIPMEGWRPHRARTIFEHLSVLSATEEIHCINSSFAILADLIAAPGKKYLHRYARPDGGHLPVFGREWTILEKPL